MNKLEQMTAQFELVDYIDQKITEAIKVNGGARTKDQVLAVFNSTLLLLHELRSDLYEGIENNSALQSIKITNVLGGIRL